MWAISSLKLLEVPELQKMIIRMPSFERITASAVLAFIVGLGTLEVGPCPSRTTFRISTPPWHHHWHQHPLRAVYPVRTAADEPLATKKVALTSTDLNSNLFR